MILSEQHITLDYSIKCKNWQRVRVGRGRGRCGSECLSVELNPGGDYDDDGVELYGHLGSSFSV